MLRTSITFIVAAIPLFLSAQTISDIENFNLGSNDYWNGSTSPGGSVFSSGNATYVNAYDTTFGGYWASGWAYSTMQDDSTAGFTNQYSAITASGAESSSTYAVGQQNTIVKLANEALGGVVNGLYVTNSTYAFLSMRDGDFFAKVFGDSLNASGQPDGTNGEDFFKLTIGGWYNAQPVEDSVEFYLADFRFSDNNLDYILEDWEWVNLSKLGNVDSLKFTLRSSDNGFFGMNTPAFFCIDNLTTKDESSIDTTLTIVNGDSLYVVGDDTFEIFDGEFVTMSIETSNQERFQFFPNPTNDRLNIILNEDATNSISIFNQNGEAVISNNSHLQEKTTIDVSALASGMYFIRIMNSNEPSSPITRTFVKR